MQEAKLAISSGSDPMDRALRGGIPLGSLTLIEGPSGSGKSVLCQHLALGALLADLRVAYYFQGKKEEELVTQMDSLSLDVTDYWNAEQFRLFPVEVSVQGTQAHEGKYQLLLAQLVSMSEQVDVIFMDFLTQTVVHSTPGDTVSFFATCKTLCAKGTTILISLHSYALDKRLLKRCHSLFDAHLSLRIEGLTYGMRTEEMNVLEVSKVQNVDTNRKNTIYFRVNPELGTSMNISIDVLPYFKFKV